jgi:uncharacterized Zn-binding protein involved in type VI secretion
MGKPAARVGDLHTCPLVIWPMPPHVGGPIMPPGIPSVFIGGLPAATIGNLCICVGPPDTIMLGSFGVLITNKPAARIGDSTSHGGVITAGCPTVLIGEVSGAALIAAINIVLSEINADRGTINCGNIIDGVVDFLKGRGIKKVVTTEDGSWEEIDGRLGTSTDFSNTTTFDNVFSDLETRGPGSITLIGIIYNDAADNAHVIVAANINGTVGVMEGQGGSGFITNAETANTAYGNGGLSTITSSPVP